MSQRSKTEEAREGSDPPAPGPWRTLLHLARPFRARAFVIVCLAALSTAASLVEPLIYRVAVNDVAGLFVGKAQEETERPEDELDSVRRTGLPEAGLIRAVYQTGEGRAAPRHESARKRRRHERYEEPHRPGHVSPRTPAQTLNTFVWAVTLMFVLSIFSYLIWLIADNMSAKVASEIETGFIRKVFGHVLRLPLSFFGRRGSGALTRQIDQVDQVAPVVNGFTQTLLPECMTLVGAFAIMVTQNWEMTLVALLTLPLYFFVAWRSARRLEKGLEDYYTQWEEVSGRIQDSLSAIKTVKLSGAEGREIEKFGETSRAAYEAYIRRARLENRFAFWEHAVTQLGQALVLGLGGWFALRHELTPGDVVMFVSYVGMLYGPIDSLTGLAIELQQYGIALRRALRLTQTETEPQAGAQPKHAGGRVEFRDVHFSYEPGREVLCGLTLTVEPGQFVGLVGPSGAGKTTTVDLLTRLYEPTSGVILIDGQRLSDLNAAAVRRELGVVAAESAVFRGTLADNVRYKRPEATDEEVHAAALAAGLGTALGRMPDGLESRVGEGGIGLSFGERQRLQLARVLAANPHVMVLDEATANLDYDTELKVKRALATLRKGRTTIVIAHRFSMVRDAAYVYVLEQGRVIEAGTPDELIAAGGWFAGFAASGSTAEDSGWDGDEGSTQDGEEGEDSEAGPDETDEEG